MTYLTLAQRACRAEADRIIAARKRMKFEQSARYRAYQWVLTRFFGGLFILFAFVVLVPACLALGTRQPNGKESA